MTRDPGKARKEMLDFLEAMALGDSSCISLDTFDVAIEYLVWDFVNGVYASDRLTFIVIDPDKSQICTVSKGDD